MSYKFASFALFCVLTAGCALNPMDAAQQDIRSGNNKGAVEKLLPLARQGDPRAQYELGRVYRDRLMRGPTGSGASEAVEWITKAAEQGYTEAESDLGAMYGAGKLVPQNFPEAMKWYRRAAEKNYARAQALLGYMYAHGEGVAKNDVEAAIWFRRSAEQGEARGQFWLGMAYADGAGVAKDNQQAELWLRKAAEQKYVPARYVLGFFYELSNPANLTEAARWLTGKEAKTEQAAQFLMGTFYREGVLVDSNSSGALAWALRRRGMSDPEIVELMKTHYQRYAWSDPMRAITYYRAAADTGFIPAQVDLGYMYSDDKSPYWDCGESFKLTKAAADRGDTSAQLNLGRLLVQGPEKTVVRAGVRMKDVKTGIEIEDVEKGSAAEIAGVKTGDVIVTVDKQPSTKLRIDGFRDLVLKGEDKPIVLGMARSGRKDILSLTLVPRKITIKCPGSEKVGFVANPAEGVKWFKKASDNGSLAGLFMLAQSYQKGTGVAQDYAQAMKLYEQGADKGDWEAAQAISRMYFNGDGVSKDKEKGESWYRRALKLKHDSVRR